MNLIYKLFKYQYHYYNQGTKEIDVEYVLLHIPENIDIYDIKELLYQQRHDHYNHNIDLDSIVDLSIKF